MKIDRFFGRQVVYRSLSICRRWRVVVSEPK